MKTAPPSGTVSYTHLQGDPGESRFYISLEDDLMRLFGSESLMNTFRKLGVAENEQIEHKMLSSAIEKLSLIHI